MTIINREQFTERLEKAVQNHKRGYYGMSPETENFVDSLIEWVFPLPEDQDTIRKRIFPDSE